MDFKNWIENIEYKKYFRIFLDVENKRELRGRYIKFPKI